MTKPVKIPVTAILKYLKPFMHKLFLMNAFSYEWKHLSSYQCLEKPFYISSNLFFDRMKEVRSLRAYLRYKWLWLSENIISLEEDRIMFGKSLKSSKSCSLFYSWYQLYQKENFCPFKVFFGTYTYFVWEGKSCVFKCMHHTVLFF